RAALGVGRRRARGPQPPRGRAAGAVLPGAVAARGPGARGSRRRAVPCPSLISCEHVGFEYGARPIVRDVSIAVAPGELVAVVGPNGAGKTTLTRLVVGLLPPARGSVRVGGLDPATAPRREVARRLAYVPQVYEMAFPFTVAEVVLMGRYPHRTG